MNLKRSARSGYTLVVCEKPDAAKRVAEALASGMPSEFKENGILAYRADDGRGTSYVVCAASGHLFGPSDTVKSRRVYPAFDLEWFPLEAVPGKRTRFVSGRIRAIASLAAGAERFVNACDLDMEGEAIGYNVLRYACGDRQATALRARFSSLTKEDLVEAFREENLLPMDGRAEAGRLRHALDFVWGVNLSRALTEPLAGGGAFRTVSIGRVQGPTLNFVVEKEIEAGAFVPTPYWKVRGRFNKDGMEFEAPSVVPAFHTRGLAEAVVRACEGADAVVSRNLRTTFNLRAPPPFNLSELQKDAFKEFGYPPSRTLQIAERLYLKTAISYPRTGSQRLPKLDYRRLLSRIGGIVGYSGEVGRLLAQGRLRPSEGQALDPAHPAIYPTGENRLGSMGADDRRLFDLVVRRFLACFAEDAVRELNSMEITVGEHRFSVEETRTLVPGWTGIVRQSRPSEAPVLASSLREGDCLKVSKVMVEERSKSQPRRYDQSTLLEKMEGEGIGTKATRAGIIQIMLERGYVEGSTLAPTDLGLALVQTMREHCPEIVSSSLTRRVEEELESMEQGHGPSLEFFEGTLSSLLSQMSGLRLRQTELVADLGSASKRPTGGIVLGRCPVCREGDLYIVRSRSTGKRFVGCTNYGKGCKASAPLPQRGGIRAVGRPCRACGWPVVYVRSGRWPWRLCVNDKCPKKVNVYKMQKLQGGPRERRPARPGKR